MSPCSLLARAMPLPHPPPSSPAKAPSRTMTASVEPRFIRVIASAVAQ